MGNERVVVDILEVQPVQSFILKLLNCENKIQVKLSKDSLISINSLIHTSFSHLQTNNYNIKYFQFPMCCRSISDSIFDACARKKKPLNQREQETTKIAECY